MGFFEDIIKKAHEGVEQDKKSELIVPIVQSAYIKVKSKYRGLEGKIYCMKFAKGNTWWTTSRSFIKAMHKLAYAGSDYLVIIDERADVIIIGNQEGIIK
jgi:hypothetical protein